MKEKMRCATRQYIKTQVDKPSSTSEHRRCRVHRVSKSHKQIKPIRPLPNSNSTVNNPQREITDSRMYLENPTLSRPSSPSKQQHDSYDLISSEAPNNYQIISSDLIRLNQDVDVHLQIFLVTSSLVRLGITGWVGSGVWFCFLVGELGNARVKSLEGYRVELSSSYQIRERVGENPTFEGR